MRQPCRLTWGGLLRILARCTDRSFTKDHIYIIMPDGHKVYVNLKYDARQHPYFVTIRNKERN